MGYTPPEWIWFNGETVPWHQATTHVMAHAIHYGSSVFEGARVYDTPNGPAGFRLREHIERLFASARIYNIDMPYSVGEIIEACHTVVQMNGLRSAYLRPVAYRGAGTLGLLPAGDTPVEVAVAGIEWGTYLGEDAQEQGADVCVSSWQRPAPNTLPLLAKAGGHYLSSQLIAAEAVRHGYVEGIALDVNGHVSEGPGENIFVVRDSTIYTTPISGSILEGITRDTVITLAEANGIEVRQQTLPREVLYVADEIFLSGTAAEITPVRSVDGVRIGTGTVGPVTRTIHRAFHGLFDGSTPDQWGWLEPIAQSPARRAVSG